MTLLVPADLVALALGVSESTVRSWATRGHVRRHGKDARGRTLYDLDEAAEWHDVDSTEQAQHNA